MKNTHCTGHVLAGLISCTGVTSITCHAHEILVPFIIIMCNYAELLVLHCTEEPQQTIVYSRTLALATHDS